MNDKIVKNEYYIDFPPHSLIIDYDNHFHLSN